MYYAFIICCRQREHSLGYMELTRTARTEEQYSAHVQLGAQTIPGFLPEIQPESATLYRRDTITVCITFIIIQKSDGVNPLM